MATANIFDLITSIPEFNGKPEELHLFIQQIEEVRKYVNPEFYSLFDIRVRNKIVSNASTALIDINNPSSWEEIKEVLRTNFSISESIEAIINKMKLAECRNSVNNLYDYLLGLLTKLNLKCSNNNDEWYSCERNEKMVLKLFVGKLPSEPKLILNARNPNTLLKAKEILVETDYFHGGNSTDNLKLQTSFLWKI